MGKDVTTSVPQCTEHEYDSHSGGVLLEKLDGFRECRTAARPERETLREHAPSERVEEQVDDILAANVHEYRPWRKQKVSGIGSRRYPNDICEEPGHRGRMSVEVMAHSKEIMNE
ncbi:hypothetical protein Y032_0159g3302 [Ancylostoma ceylanicum]|uniref:Uncharacterized protein n=1 Tax=Ancylostoma ceylanicum TaxID=53326 RepID=A0A016SYN9_9BILA|nr:hypothetical protein Y032_0159g3302 [Ancylostoma ceylanicum]